MDWKDNMGSWLKFSKKERTGIIVVILVILGLFLMTPVYHTKQQIAVADTGWISQVRELMAEQDDARAGSTSFTTNKTYHKNTYQRAGSTENTTRSLFVFDPNILDAGGWKKLGIRQKTINTIMNFRNKGGKFRTPSDLQKIYGLFPDEFDRIEPYIQIATIAVATSTTASPPLKSYTPRALSPIDINTCDTGMLIALPGIGSKLATRIISFREKLGGFYDVNQVGETFGLADSVFQKIRHFFKNSEYPVKKININKATIDDLKTHPYIRYALANPIIAYRNAHGNFEKLEDLKNIMAISETMYLKMLPYLEL